MKSRWQVVFPTENTGQTLMCCRLARLPEDSASSLLESPDIFLHIFLCRLPSRCLSTAYVGSISPLQLPAVAAASSWRCGFSHQNAIGAGVGAAARTELVFTPWAVSPAAAPIRKIYIWPWHSFKWINCSSWVGTENLSHLDLQSLLEHEAHVRGAGKKKID